MVLSGLQVLEFQLDLEVLCHQQVQKVLEVLVHHLILEIQMVLVTLDFQRGLQVQYRLLGRWDQLGHSDQLDLMDH